MSAKQTVQLSLQLMLLPSKWVYVFNKRENLATKSLCLSLSYCVYADALFYRSSAFIYECSSNACRSDGDTAVPPVCPFVTRL